MSWWAGVARWGRAYRLDIICLAEVPLIALMFLVMVWHGQRRVAAMQERLAAMEEVQRVSQENLRLLKEQQRFLQDASHELGTPITVALGHAELMERAASETVLADDARVVAGELRRLGRMASRILLLASAGSPDFLHPEPVTVESVLDGALERWGYLPRQWRLGPVTDVTVVADRDRLALALDALLENAIAHTASGGGIEVSATAHHGSVQVQSTPGRGSSFELILPLTPAAAPAAVPAAGPAPEPVMTSSGPGSRLTGRPGQDE